MKKTFKRILSVLLVVAMLVGVAPVSEIAGLDLDWLDFSTKSSALEASGQCGENVYWTFDESTGLLTISGEGGMENYGWSDSPFFNNSSIKTVVIKKGVKSIGYRVFECCKGLTSIIIPDSVTCIGTYAFRSCIGLTCITIPESVTSILGGAFGGCKGLTSITIPDGVTDIYYDAFESCISLTSIMIPDSVTGIGDSAFYNCVGLTSITIPDSVTSIGDNAFKGCTSLTSIAIPDSVTSIGECAFYKCISLTSLNIPEGITSIGYAAFVFCNELKKINVSENNKVYDSRNNCNAIIETESNTLIAGCKNTIIPNSVTSIGDVAFENCRDLTDIKIPDSVTSIEEGAFAVCTKIKSITIPNSVINIGNGAFMSCRSLASITISDNVTSIDHWTFSSCSSLTSITIPDSVTSIGDSAFSDCTGLASIAIPDSVTSIGCLAFDRCYNLTDVYYSGSEIEWEKMSIDSGNECLTDATIHFNPTSPDSIKPTGSISSTNNIASSQTVTLSFSDNVGVAGYYWGTNLNYADNTYTSTNSSSATKTISDSGTYYLTVKDTSGNISQNYSVTFYKTTLNANGGSVSPTSVLTKSGNSFSFPTPTRIGYAYSGWSTSSSATSGVKTLKPTSNSTYYAVWKSDTSGFNQNNRYNFSNSSYNFVTSWSGGNYYMTQSDYNKLTSYIKKYDRSSSSTISSVQNLMYSSWGGSCYGMAATAVLDYQNKIGFNENFGNGVKTMWDVASPSTDPNIMSAINYYMVSQVIGFVRNSSTYYDKYYYSSSWTPGLKKLVSTAQKGEPFLFCYYWTEFGQSYGHAIVALNCKTNADGSFSIAAYDNRYPSKDVIIKVNSSYTSCVVNGDENANSFEIYSNMSGFDKIDIDGPKNDMKINYNSYSYSNTNDEISIVADSDVTVTNANGESISVINGNISSTMDIISVHRIVRSTEEGNPAPAEYVFEVGHNKSYYFESNDDNMEVSVKTSQMFGSATSENADYIAIGEDGVYVIGDNIEYSASLCSKDNEYETVLLEGSSKNDVSLTYSDNDIIINGINGNDEAIKIFAHNEMNPKEYAIKDGYNKVKIVSEKDEIDIKGSTHNDERFDVSVLKKNRVQSVSIGDISLNYKKSTTLKPTITADEGAEYTVKYSTSNTKVATVDNNGKVTATKRGSGSATITCTVTDSNGNTVTDTCKVSVKLSFGQILITYILFGWIWY